METVQLTFLGDVSFSGQNINADSPFVTDDILEYFRLSDAVICNFESSVSADGHLGLFQSSEASISNLRHSGITHAFVANNHIYDYGQRGFMDTLSVLQSNGIGILGLSQYRDKDQRVTSLSIKGVSIGLLCCGWTKVSQKDGLSEVSYWEYNEGEIIDALREHKGRFDHLILVLHKGKMFVEYPSYVDRKAYLKYIELGATAVIGHHAHVVQGVNSKEGKVLAYSLGNFFFDSEEGHVKNNFSKQRQDTGLMLSLTLSKNELVGFETVPILKEASGVVKLSAKKRADFEAHFEKISSRSNSWFINNIFYLLHYTRFVLPHFIRVKFHHKLKRRSLRRQQVSNT